MPPRTQATLSLLFALPLLGFELGCSSNSAPSSNSAGGALTGVPSSGGAGASSMSSAGSVDSSFAGAAAAATGSGAGGSGAGVSAGAGGDSAPSTAGASPGGGTSGAGDVGAAGARSGASGSAASGGLSGGSGGSSSFPSTAPTPDSASKVPISKPPAGYAVQGNFAYGPLTAQRLDVLYPSNGGPKATQALPAVLMFHGGAWIHSYTNNYGSGKDHMSTFFDRFLAHGFIVFNAEYRVNDNTPDGAPAPAAVQDALLAAQWCWNYLDYFHGDRSKFVVTGASAGGHLALMVGLTTPAAALGPTSPANFKIDAIVSGYGPADIEAELNAVAKDWIPANLPNRAAIAKEVNPITYVRGDAPPLIVVQGANDTTAPVPDSQHLVQLLTAAGADASIHLVPGAGHGFDDSTWPDAEKAMFDWLKQKGLGN